MKFIIKEFKKYKIECLFLVFLCIFTFILISKFIENDVFFSLKSGEYILKNGVNEVDFLSIHDNLKFIKLRWAFDLLIYGLYSLFGFEGLYYFTVLVSFIIAIALYESLVFLYKSKFLSFLITCFTIYYLKDGLICRAQIISYLLFLLEMFFLQRLLDTNDNKYVLYLCFISVLLVNFHASVWLVFFLPFLPIFAENFIILFLKAIKVCELKKISIEYKEYRKIYITFFICLFTGLISPLGLNPYTYIFKIMSGITKEFIVELQPISIIDTFPLNIMLIIFLGFIIFTKIKVDIKDFFYIIGFFIMAKLAIRNSYIAIIFLAFLFNKIIIDVFNNYSISFIFTGIENKIQNSILFDLFIFLFLFYHLKINYYNYKIQEYIPDYYYPVKVTEFFKNNVDINNSRVFCDLNCSSYMEFSGIKTFIDTRTEVYTKEFSNVDVINDYYNLQYKRNYDMREFVEKYNLTHFIVYNYNYLIEDCEDTNEFHIIYKDDNFTILEREKSEI